MGLLQVGKQLFPACGEVPAVGRGWGYSRCESNSSPLVGKSRPKAGDGATPGGTATLPHLWGSPGRRPGMGLLQVGQQLFPTCGEVPAVGRGWGYSRWESNSSPL